MTPWPARSRAPRSRSAPMRGWSPSRRFSAPRCSTPGPARFLPGSSCLAPPRRPRTFPPRSCGAPRGPRTARGSCSATEDAEGSRWASPSWRPSTWKVVDRVDLRGSPGGAGVEPRQVAARRLDHLRGQDRAPRSSPASAAHDQARRRGEAWDLSFSPDGKLLAAGETTGQSRSSTPRPGDRCTSPHGCTTPRSSTWSGSPTATRC